MSLVHEYNIDILITAEYSADKNELSKLFKEHYYLAECNTYGCNRIDSWSSYADTQAGRQDDYYSIQIIRKSIVLCSVHLPSDLYGEHGDERLAKIQEIMYEIKETECEINSQKTVIIGDFNEMPYTRAA